jgi:VWFA-related protein
MRAFNAATLPLLLLAGFAGGVQPQDPAFRISVDVDLVVLQATVRDGNGQFASELREQDFAVYEDGVRQSIRLFRHEDIPVTVGLVIDHSGSMREKVPEVIAAARTFVHASNQEDEMFIVDFNEHVVMGLPNATPFTNRVDDLESAILRAPTIGMTALYDAVVKAQERLQTGSRDKKVLIVISDGSDNASKHTLAEILQKVEQSTALVYTIGVFEKDDPDGNPHVLKRLAQVTGGEAFFSGDREQLVAACERIARDIRHQYTIGYVPTAAARPGVYRSIRVVAAAPGHGKLSVRARAGYIPGEAAK